jgi:hypothetical protein
MHETRFRPAIYSKLLIYFITSSVNPSRRVDLVGFFHSEFSFRLFSRSDFLWGPLFVFVCMFVLAMGGQIF